MIPDFTIVCGTDRSHLPQLTQAVRTWQRFKPSLMNRPLIVFRDHSQVSDVEIRQAINHPNLSVYAWPMGNVSYGEKKSKPKTEKEQYEALWTNPQRYKMLAGFVYVSAYFVMTPYWLKLDACVSAKGNNEWIDPKWFKDDPAIVSHRWGYTKPANQMLKLDQWVFENRMYLPSSLVEAKPLDLKPDKDKPDRVSHKRIISWAAFFDTEFTKQCVRLAQRVCGPFKLPCCSQDGFLWYMAKRQGLGIRRVNMKKRGWEHRPTRPFSMDVLKG